MGYIPGDVIEDIRGRFDLVEVVSSYIDLRKTGKNYVGLCPFHSEKTPSFTVSPEKQIFYCFGCQNGGNVFSFIMQMEGFSFPEAVRHLARRAGIDIDPHPSSPLERENRRRREMLLAMNSLAQKYYQKLLWETLAGKKALEHLFQRGLNEQTIQDFGLGYAPHSWKGLIGELRKKDYDLKLAAKGGLVGEKPPGRFYDYFRERLIFPIEDAQGRVIAFGGRILGRGEPKYLNTPESPLFNKRRILYGFHRALPEIRKKKEALLVEGYMDVLTLYQHGITETLATMGTALTDTQFSLLRSRLDRVILVFDADTGGEAAALRGLKLLKNEGCQVRVAQLPPGYDPADFVLRYGEKSFREDILSSAKSLTGYRLAMAKKQHNPDTKEGRINYWKEARDILKEVEEILEREEYLKIIAGEINASLEVLREDLENKLRSFHTQNKNTVIKAVKDNNVSLREKVERELLSCVIRFPRYLERLHAQEIGIDSFTAGPHREIARCLFDSHQKGQEISVAELLSYFSKQEMHKLIISMAMTSNPAEETRVDKIVKDCLRRIKTLHWAAEREKLIKSLRENNNREKIGAKLKRIHDLKRWEEELYRSGEGEDFDV
ncbi:MAG: DNA primase [Firmicutes bacterium]|nr:DNA primase [Bacillota bacterium]